ncbi:hypothetical protein K7432_008152 [Basidiobolus ranarum]|uniref:Uncharacterized protein n=1 Tax=Basidiobolus ranarum TaxID=34480 RepID=A0ABR2VZ24_9FUNG
MSVARIIRTVAILKQMNGRTLSTVSSETQFSNRRIEEVLKSGTARTMLQQARSQAARVQRAQPTPNKQPNPSVINPSQQTNTITRSL